MIKKFCMRFCMLPVVIQALLVASLLMGIAVTAGFPN